MNFYTGVGSRKASNRILNIIRAISKFNSDQLKFILRSGGADGCDLAFEDMASNLKEIWVPWLNFNRSSSNNLPNKEAFTIASEIHSGWDYLSSGAQKLHARNIHQVLGRDLNIPSKFLTCWTEKGKCIGGTATAIKLAKQYNIPIFNIGHFEKFSDEIILDYYITFLTDLNYVDGIDLNSIYEYYNNITTKENV